MPKVKVFVKEVIIHEKIVDMDDALYSDYLDDELSVDMWAADQMNDTTVKETYDWIHGEIEKL